MYLEHEFRFAAYGVKVGIESNRVDLLERAVKVARKALVDNLEPIGPEEVDHVLGVTLDENGTYTIYQNGEKNTYGDSDQKIFKFFGSLIRLTVAEFAPDRIFLHAGVVGWKGKAIVMPADSFQGKSTLVAELLRQGAEYYSDEYAIFDENGLVHPFPRALAVRGIEGEYVQTDVSAESLGAAIGTKPIPVGMVLITSYSPEGEWKPELISEGLGVMEMIPHTIPIRVNSDFSLKVLKIIVNRAIIAKSIRNEAKEFSKILLNFFDNALV